MTKTKTHRWCAGDTVEYDQPHGKTKDQRKQATIVATQLDAEGVVQVRVKADRTGPWIYPTERNMTLVKAGA